MNRFIILALGGLLSRASAGAQTPASLPLLTPAQMQRDLAVLHEAVKVGHPVAGVYHPLPYLDSCAAATQARLTAPLTARQFRAALRPYVAALGCGHTSLQPSAAALRAAATSPEPFVLPLRFFGDSSRLFVAAAPGVAPEKVRPGDEIVSIDQHPAATIVQDILAAVPSDGYNQTHRRYNLQQNGAVYYAVTYDLRDTYDVELRDAASGQRRTIQLSRAEVDTAAARLAAVRLRPVPGPGTTVLRQEAFGSLAVLPGTPAVAVLTIAALTGKQKSFYRAAFAEIRRRGIQHLVLDLRGNGGGGVFTGNELLRYLLPRPYRFVIETGPAQRRLRRRLDMGLLERLTPGLLSMYPNQRRRAGRHQICFGYRPRAQRFAGQLLVLTDGGTFSMGSYVAAYLQQLAGAMVVGEETGGGAAGSYAMLSGYLRLPESQQRLRLPVYHIAHQLPRPDVGHGVLPDVPVRPTLADVLARRDPVLEVARQLVK